MTPDEAIKAAMPHYAAYQDLIRQSSASSGAGCWIWAGSAKTNEYGVVRILGVRVLAHRLSLAVFKGAPFGAFALHSCDTPACVNPAHLRSGSQLENVQDMDARGRRVRGNAPAQTGRDNPNAIVTEEQVHLVRRLKAEGHTYSEIERLTGVRRANAWAIATGKSWSHVPFAQAYTRERRERPRGFDGKVRDRRSPTHMIQEPGQ